MFITRLNKNGIDVFLEEVTKTVDNVKILTVKVTGNFTILIERSIVISDSGIGVVIEHSKGVVDIKEGDYSV